jgi:RNA polymerase sigma factor (sigma-70 family)
MKENAGIISRYSTFWISEVSKIAKVLKKKNYLSNEEKSDLFLKWRDEKCIKSRDLLIKSALPFALKIVHDYYRSKGKASISIEDLEQEANLAVIDALDDYDPEKGSFPTFLRSRVPKFLFPAVRAIGNTVHIPSNIFRDMSLENKATEKYIRENGHEPAIGDTYLFTYNDKKYDIVFGKSISQIPFIDTEFVENEEEGYSNIDFFSLNTFVDNNSDYALQSDFVLDLLDDLNENETKLIKYGLFTSSLSENLSEIWPSTKEEIKQLLTNSKKKITYKIGKKSISQFFYVSPHFKNVHSIAKKLVSQENDNIEINFLSKTYENKNVFICDESNIILSFFINNDFKDTFKLFIGNKEITNEIIFEKYLENSEKDIYLCTVKIAFEKSYTYTKNQALQEIKNIIDKLRKKLFNYGKF